MCSSDLVLDAHEPEIAALSDAGQPPQRVAFHAPCSLQHGQRVRGVAERLLGAAGCEVTGVPDSHLCCGSAGTYSILQPELARRLRDSKVAALESGRPEIIATGNIGCLTHLQSGSTRPVRHWIEVIDQRLATRPSTD